MRDGMNNANLQEVSTNVMSLADTLGGRIDEGQSDIGSALVSLAAGLMTVCKAAQISPQDVLSMADNIIHDADGRRPEFMAAETYFKKEVLKNG